jgi:hypothetical protein
MLGASILWIVRNCYRDEILRAWWKCDSQKNHVGFLQLLSLSASAFTDLRLIREAAFVTLDILEDFLSDFEEQLREPANPLMKVENESERASERESC